MNARDALTRITTAHHENREETSGSAPYPVDAVGTLLASMNELARRNEELTHQAQENLASAGVGGDTLHINANGGATKVSIKGERNSRGVNWEYRIEETAKGGEDLTLLQSRVERAFDAGCERMSKKYGAAGTEKGVSS